MRVSCCLLTLAFAALTGCGSGPAANGGPPKTDVAPAVESALTFVLSGDTGGFIVPCGCATKQFGGLPRRATYLKDARRAAGSNLIYVDAGGSVSRGTAYDALKFEFILRGTAKMAPAAINIGAAEMVLGAASLGQMAREAPLFSTNLRPPGNSALWRDVITLNVQGTRVAILGICVFDKERHAGSGIEVLDPRAVLRERVPALAREFDAVILLAHGSEDAVLKLARDFPELSAVFLAGAGQSVAPRDENGLTVAAVGQKGKFLAQATLVGRRNAWKLRAGKIVELSEDFADDADQIANLSAYKQRLKIEKLNPNDTGEASPLLKSLPADYRYAGTAACAKCHLQDAAIHTSSKHAHGLETLRAKDFEFDPYCLKCHTTGYGGRDGFTTADATPQLGGIGCENCHGPSQAHVGNARVKTPFRDAKTACGTCHDPDNSPKFDFNTYWPRILHGKEKAQ